MSWIDEIMRTWDIIHILDSTLVPTLFYQHYSSNSKFCPKRPTIHPSETCNGAWKWEGGFLLAIHDTSERPWLCITPKCISRCTVFEIQLASTKFATTCVCNKSFTIDCPTGGFPTLRHNGLRDYTAARLSEVRLYRTASTASFRRDLQPGLH